MQSSEMDFAFFIVEGFIGANMLDLTALLLSVFILFMFGISIVSLTVIAVIMIASFLLLSTLSFIFKFAFWALLALFIYYFFFKNDKDNQ